MKKLFAHLSKNAGFTLVDTLMAAGLLSVVVLATVSNFELTNKTEKQTLQNIESISLQLDITKILTDTTNCTATAIGADMSTNTDIVSIVENSEKKYNVYSLNNDTYMGKKIIQIIATEPNTVMPTNDPNTGETTPPIIPTTNQQVNEAVGLVKFIITLQDENKNTTNFEILTTAKIVGGKIVECGIPAGGNFNGTDNSPNLCNAIGAVYNSSTNQCEFQCNNLTPELLLSTACFEQNYEPKYIKKAGDTLEGVLKVQDKICQDLQCLTFTKQPDCSNTSFLNKYITVPDNFK